MRDGTTGEPTMLLSYPATLGATTQEPFLAVLRELAQAYHAFSAYSAAHVRQLGLTPAQFDVIATLGNTQGMPLTPMFPIR